MSESTQISFTPVGRIITGYTKIEDCPPRGGDNRATSLIEIESHLAEGLRNIELATHLVVLYWLDRSDRTALLRRTRPGEVMRGVFASRTPNRPNPIAFSVVRIEGREDNKLTVSGLDCLDDTPVIDIKPYVVEDDCVPEAFIGWDCGCKAAPSTQAGEAC